MSVRRRRRPTPANEHAESDVEDAELDEKQQRSLEKWARQARASTKLPIVQGASAMSPDELEAKQRIVHDERDGRAVVTVVSQLKPPSKRQRMFSERRVAKGVDKGSNDKIKKAPRDEQVSEAGRDNASEKQAASSVGSVENQNTSSAGWLSPCKALRRFKSTASALSAIAVASSALMTDVAANLTSIETLFNILEVYSSDDMILPPLQFNSSPTGRAVLSVALVLKYCLPEYLEDCDERGDSEQNGNTCGSSASVAGNTTTVALGTPRGRLESKSARKTREIRTALHIALDRLTKFLEKRLESRQPESTCRVVTELLLGIPPYLCGSVGHRLLRLCVQLSALKPGFNSGIRRSCNDNELLELVSVASSSCLGKLISHDTSLQIAVQVVKIANALASAGSGRNRHHSNATKYSIRGALVDSLSCVDLEGKYRRLEREAYLRGINPLSSKLSADVSRDLAASSTHGPAFGKFRVLRTQFLEGLFVLLLTVLQCPEKFSRDTLGVTLRSLPRLANQVNENLICEICEALKTLVHDKDTAFLQSTEKFFALISVAKLARLVKTQSMQVDITWLPEKLSSLTLEMLPRMLGAESSLGSVFPPEPLSGAKTVGKWSNQIFAKSRQSSAKFSAEGFSTISLPSTGAVSRPGPVDGLLEMLLESLDFVLRASELSTQTGNYGCCSPVLVRLVETLVLTGTSIADPIVAHLIFSKVGELVQRYPSVQELFDGEGIILRGTGEEKSLFWCAQLLRERTVLPDAIVKATL